MSRLLLFIEKCQQFKLGQHIYVRNASYFSKEQKSFSLKNLRHKRVSFQKVWFFVLVIYFLFIAFFSFLLDAETNKTEEISSVWVACRLVCLRFQCISCQSHFIIKKLFCENQHKRSFWISSYWGFFFLHFIVKNILL